MDLATLTEELRELWELVSPITQPFPKLKKKVAGAHGYGPSSGSGSHADVGTRGGRPSAMGKNKDDGDGTKAGVKHKDVPDTKASAPKGRDTKTQATPGTKAKTGADGKPSCPGGQQPRMVFGKWRCAGGGSGGAQKAKARIATKRKQKPKKKPVQKGTLAKLIGKAREAFKGLFK